MGIDVHGLNFLRYAKKSGAFGETITVARPGFHVVASYVREPYIREMVNALAESQNGKYCEELLRRYFGSKSVDSLDNSDYEGASIVHDMNQPLPSDIVGLYDTVIDAGTLEHVYNIPQALKNCSALCKPGGQILHILPANNFCGHGFWQFTPELFFSLYSSENGYSETEVFLADVCKIDKWYKVKKPRKGQRVNVHTSNRLHVLVRTVLAREDFSHKDVQQSDYITKWQGKESSVAPLDQASARVNIIQSIKNSKIFSSLLLPLYRSYYRLRPAPTMKLNNLNPGLTKYSVSSLLMGE